MCGILGIATTQGRSLSISDEAVCQLRDLMTHRGPDSAGLWRSEHIALAHRRLAIIDPTPAGAQPMVSTDGRFVLVYNGELYNTPELREQLMRDGVQLRSACDTEVVLGWLGQHWEKGVADLRGMYALAIYDTLEHRLLLARDPLGIKPLVYWKGWFEGSLQLLFASELAPILAHAAVDSQPDMATASAYLTTIRTTLGSRTMYAGVSMLLPGQSLCIDLASPSMAMTNHDRGIESFPRALAPDEYTIAVTSAIEDSVTRHLRADVPTCCLLSGGLDSAIITTLAAAQHPALRTYCAGAPGAAPVGGLAQADDFGFACSLAASLGTHHAEAAIDQRLFLERWPWIIEQKCTPMSTPNEVAIHEVARLLRRDGFPVTLSGEGADELFGGYDQPLSIAAAALKAGSPEPALVQLHAGAWCPLESKAELLTESAWASAEHDRALLETARHEFARIARDDDPLADQLRMQRRINLAGLLDRLDSSTMLASVEGRTPFADSAVAALAESLPMGAKCVLPGQTKIVLRQGFGAVLPAEIIARPKASFPLPFQQWIEPAGQWIGASQWLDGLLKPEAKALLAARPAEYWRLAWPIANLALWGRRFE